MLTFIIVTIIGFAIYFFMKNKKVKELKDKSDLTVQDKTYLDYENFKKVKNKVKMNGWLFDFDNQRFFEPYKMTQKQGHLFSEVAEIQVVEQKHGETKKHTITRPLGAIIGVAAGKG